MWPHYFPQSESTASSTSGVTGSLVLTFTRKSCKPSMPLCIMNSIESGVLCPGWMVVEPTTALGGQQPCLTSTIGWLTICSG